MKFSFPFFRAAVFFTVPLLSLSADPLPGDLSTPESSGEHSRADLERRVEELQMRLDLLEAERETASPPAATTPIRPGGFAGRPWIDVSAIGTFAAGASTERHVDELQAGGHDPRERGFNVQSLELVLSGAVDPYFRGQANITFTGSGHGHGHEGGSSVELEEAFLETLALPANLQARAGLFLTEFGRHNNRHLHTWDFVDAPLISTRMFGPEGLRNPGARLSWLAPTPFYSELFFTVQSANGETAYSFRNPEGFADGVFYRGSLINEDAAEETRSLSDLLYAMRYAASTDLTDRQTVLAGVSAALGPNAPVENAGAGRTEIYGADLYWHWTPVHQVMGFPFVSWQTEAMLRRFHARNPSATFEDYGFYTQINYGFRRGWVAGLRYDWVKGDMDDAVDDGGDPLHFSDRWRLSPNLTWYPSEFSKIRLQYNYDRREREGDDHTVWLQVEFSLGPHGAHTF